MKNLLIILAIASIAACTPKTTETSTEQEERTIGFNTMLPELKWHLGTEEAIEVVKQLDKVWAAKDFDAMRTFFADTAVCYFPDGKIAESADEFIEIIKKGFEESDASWTFDYAFSVDLDPTRGGEHVQAGFTGTGVENGVETKKYYHESYYIIEGKIVMWRQYDMDIKEDK